MQCRSIAPFIWMLAISVAAPAAAEAQMFFSAEWLQYRRDQDAGASFITGEEAVSPSNVGFGSTPGYRLTLGGAVGGLQVDASFSQLDTWRGRASGVFANPVSFDELLPGNTNTLELPHGLAAASRFVGMGIDETAEAHLLHANFDDVDAFYDIRNDSNYRDFEINIGTDREASRWRVSAGYRHIRLNERSQALIGGIFDALDVDDPPVVPGDGLSHGALVASGFTLIGGAPDGFQAIDPGPPEVASHLTYQTLGRADNELNGGQVTVGFRLLETDWFDLEGIGKAGIYRNTVHGQFQETAVSTLNNESAYQRTFTDKRRTPAFAGNLGLRASVGLTDYINLIGGYEVLFLSGVALSADQVDGLSTNILGETSYRARTNGSVIAHGGNLGLEILW
jgi:hypothetical protein